MSVSRLLAAVLLAATTTAFAQTPPPPPVAPATPQVDQRQANQQQRINQGVASGELTPREARKLQREQNRIARHEAAAKADGTVTPQERRRLHREQDQASRHIAKKKHNRRDAPAH
jgi:hypothetical protein